MLVSYSNHFISSFTSSRFSFLQLRITRLILRTAALAGLGLALSACTNTVATKGVNASFNFTAPVKRVVIVQPDVELGELTAGGLVETRADWTAAAKTFISQDVAATLGSKNIEVVHDDKPPSEHTTQIVKLHDVVGQEAIFHTLADLPNKGGAFDWTLGPGTNDLREEYGADYALFVYVRDSYTSAGRVMMMIGLAAVGVGIQGGQQVGFVSLVDLRNGNIVWFNRLASTNGDLREEKPARAVVDNLLDGLPL